MRLTYTRHAQRRMVQRNVTRADIENALQHYIERLATPEPSIRYRGPGLNGDILKVWVVPDGSPGADKTIKSVAWEGR
ncbi:DUF4258 domain-containing protein [Streptomyces sp. SLBN-31]|uniref:DUF4258 domain-containing protein n=1 Tax=Streptomyces sp. SLBN-31 TaxID=2768444 RepID=UPI00115443B6